MADRFVLGVAALLFILGWLAMRRAWDQAKVVRAVRDLPVSPIAPMSAGMRRVQGRLGGDPLLKSPFQGRDCVYYFFRVTTPREGKTPRTVATGKEWSLATVEDASGRAALEPWTPAVGSPRRFETVLRGLQAIPPGLEGFFERAGIDAKHLPRLPIMTIHEYTLEPGDQVYVLGTQRDDGSIPTFHRAKRHPYVVSAEVEVGLVAGLKNELLVYAAVAPLLLLAAVALVVLGVSA